MGISGLPAQLKQGGSYVKKVNSKELKDLRLGVDAYVWLHRVVSRASNDDTYRRRFHAEPQVPFYEQLYALLDDELHFWRKLEMKVVLVVDGKANPLKESVDDKRHASRVKQVDALKSYMVNGEAAGHKKLQGLAKDACHVTREVVGYFLQWANKNKVQLCGAPMEAEHQLVYMQKNDKIDWIYTVDSDVLPLGATNVIYEVKWDRGSFTLWAFTHDLVVNFFETEVMKKRGSFLLHDFVAYCVFLGCDYCDRIQGLGPVALNKSFSAVWANKDARDKMQLLVDLAAHGKYTFDAAAKGIESIVTGSDRVDNYAATFYEAFAGLSSPIVASFKHDKDGHSVLRMPSPRPAWHSADLDGNGTPICPGYEDTDIKFSFDDDMKMSNTLYTLERWPRHPEEDFVDWLPKYPIIEGVLFEQPLVWSLPEYVKVEWYWKDSVKEYLQLHGYNVPANADADDFDKLVKHVRTEHLPLLTPKSMFTDIVLQVGDIVRGEAVPVVNFDDFRKTVCDDLPDMNDEWLKRVFGKYTSAYFVCSSRRPCPLQEYAYETR